MRVMKGDPEKHLRGGMNGPSAPMGPFCTHSTWGTPMALTAHGGHLRDLLSLGHMGTEGAAVQAPCDLDGAHANSSNLLSAPAQAGRWQRKLGRVQGPVSGEHAKLRNTSKECCGDGCHLGFPGT